MPTRIITVLKKKVQVILPIYSHTAYSDKVTKQAYSHAPSQIRLFAMIFKQESFHRDRARLVRLTLLLLVE